MVKLTDSDKKREDRQRMISEFGKAVQRRVGDTEAGVWDTERDRGGRCVMLYTIRMENTRTESKNS